jgi:hypothetical protein
MSLWLKADAGLYDAASGGSAVTANGASVARWEDQSGNARHVTQAASGNRPTYVASALNGLPAVSFATAQGLRNTSLAVAQPNDVYAVFDFAADAGTLFLCDGDGSGHRQSPIFRYPSANLFRVFAGTEADTGAGSLAGGTFRLMSFRFNGAASAVRVDGTAVGSTFNPGAQGLAGVTVGNRFTLNLGLRGRLAEILIYPSALPDAGRQTVEQYLGQKWLGWTPAAAGLLPILLAHGLYAGSR